MLIPRTLNLKPELNLSEVNSVFLVLKYMYKMKFLVVICALISILPSSNGEKFPVDQETEEIAVNALYEVSRRMNEDLELVKVNSMQKEVYC